MLSLLRPSSPVPGAANPEAAQPIADSALESTPAGAPSASVRADVPQSQQPHPNPAPSLVLPSTAHVQDSAPSVRTQSSSQMDHPMQCQSQSALPYSPPGPNATAKDPRRFSLPSFSFLRSDSTQNKKKSMAGRAFTVFIVGSSSGKRAKDSAVLARAVIIGDHNKPDSRSITTKPPSKSDVARVKAQLLEPKTAAKVISHLRALPPRADDTASDTNHPIHAVCLNMPDKDVQEQHFSRIQSVAIASVPAISSAIAELHLIDLVTAPNMGLGAPATAQGLFAGAVPTAETVIDGIGQITPQLMALGYATGKAILPDHKSVFVPTDRLSVLTYWWGFEICLPPPTLAYLEAAEGPSSGLLNLLTAISVLSEGVREIVPFIRYIAQFVQSEWSLIKRADQGQGVVCTATWILPIALIPRSWDFPDPSSTNIETVGQSGPTSPSVKQFPATLTTPKPSTEVPNGAPRASSAYSAETRDDEEPRRVISSEPPVLPELVVSSPGSIDGAPPENVDGRGHHAYDKVQHNGEPTAH